MDNWVIKRPPPARVPSPPSSPDIESYEPSEDSQTYEISDNESQDKDNEISFSILSNSWINECVDRYRSSKNKHLPKDIQKEAQDRYDSLNNDINEVEKEYKAIKNPPSTFDYPSAIIDDLREYNSRRLELTLQGESNPAVTASILTSASSIR